MVEPEVAELLPQLYRAVLDRVDSLERDGYRAEAARVRADATRAYSGAWNERATRRLLALRGRADGVLDGRLRPRAPGTLHATLRRATPMRGPA